VDVIVKNSSEHDIVLTKAVKGVIQSVTFPAAVQDTDPVTGKDLLKPSETLVDTDTLELIRKDNAVAQHYFDEAVLRVDNKGSSAAAAQKKSTPPQS
jgi:hypothetical protein